MLKRCDQNYPEYAEAKNDYQYLLGDDILVAPVTTSASVKPVPPSWFSHGDGVAGLKAEYFDNKMLSGSPKVVRTDADVNFEWNHGKPGADLPKDHFSVRWTGSFTVKGDSAAVLVLSADDAARVYVDDELVIDRWVRGAPPKMATKSYKNGKTYNIRIEHFETGGGAACKLMFAHAAGIARSRDLWIPPGNWQNVFTGKIVAGPKKHRMTVPLKQMPIFVKQGSIIPLAPDMLHIGEKSWDPITLDVFPAKEATASATLYEDDGMSNGYKNGAFRFTDFSATFGKRAIAINIDPAKGRLPSAPGERSWIIRLHSAELPEKVLVDGKSVPFKKLPKDTSRMPFAATGPAPDSDVNEIALPRTSVTNVRTVTVHYNPFTKNL